MSRLTRKWQTPYVVFQPRVQEGLQAGINTIVEAIRPTLGPLHRIVVMEKASKVGRPELLDDGAIIARRIFQLEDREEDMGAMYLRQDLWKMHETVGDGTATAAVMFQKIFNEGLRYIVAGGNAMRLRYYLGEAAKIIHEELDRMAFHLHGKESFARLAETICYDPALAKVLGEIFDTIGEYGRLDIRPGRSRELEREYFEGMYWGGGVLAREMITDLKLGSVQFEDASILITDLQIKEAQELLPVLEMAVGAGVKSLFLLANSISGQALSILMSKPNREKIEVVVVKAPAIDLVTRQGAMEDLALLTGGRAFFAAAGETLSSVSPSDLGQARRVWANLEHFGIVGGKGDPRALRQHIAKLRAGFPSLKDPEDRKRLQARVGKLMSGSAVLWVGDTTPTAVEARKELAGRTAEAMRGAMREGVLPGGGIALLSCKQALQKKLEKVEDIDERVAYKIVLKALETPIYTLLENGGFDPEKILYQIELAGPGFGFDLKQGQVVDMNKSGIYDAASVVKSAAFGAIQGASLALTIDVLIHRRNPPSGSYTP